MNNHIKNECTNVSYSYSHCGSTESPLKAITIKKEYCDPIEDDDSTDGISIPIATNTILKEEIMIECEPDVEVFEVGYVCQWSNAEKILCFNWLKIPDAQIRHGR